MTGAPRRRLVIETDGGSRGNPGPAGWGAVIRDAEGTVLAERADYIGVSTNNVAEYSGLLAGLRAARAIDPGALVEVRSDSKLLVEQMSGRWQIKHEPIRHLAAQARAVFPPEQVHYSWIPREHNSAADALANEAMDLRIAVVRDAEPGAAPSDGDPVAGVAPTLEATHIPGAARPKAGLDQAAPERAPEPAGDVQEQPVPGKRAQSGAAGGQAAPVPPRSAFAGQAPPPGRAPALGSALHLSHEEPMTLVLVRHGQTDMTAARAYAGGDGPGLGLNARGRTEAAQAADLVYRIGREAWPDLPRPSAVLSSSMVRAHQTAAAIGRRLGLSVRIDDAFAECRFGQWDGLTASEIEQRWPGRLRQWHRDPTMRALGGESMQDVAGRVQASLSGLREEFTGRTVVVASHTIAIRSAVGAVTRLAHDSWPMLRIPPASVTILRIWPDGHELTVLGCPSDL